MNQENRLLKIECDNYSKYDNIYFFLSELLSEKGRESIKFYFSNNNIKNIIIYGAGTFARVLCDFINKESLCNITGVIDRDKNEEFGFHEFINIDEINEYKYDVIVITPLSDRICSYDTTLKMRDYAEKNLTWKSIMGKVLKEAGLL